MSEAQHTSGPWESNSKEVNTPYENLTIRSIRGRSICQVWMDDAPLDDFNREQECNARLIAAAPDMLEALREIRATLMNGLSDPLDAIESALVPLDNAVNKATGA